MLVKESIVKEWYNTNSWVYKNFSYLFQNPLWCKNIPRGFSLCPYFWMSLFSMCVFRPFFVFPLARIFLPIGKLISIPLTKFDRWVWVKFVMLMTTKSKEQVKLNRGAGIVVAAVTGFFLSGITFLGLSLVLLLSKLHAAHSAAPTFYFWVILSGVSLFLVVAGYNFIFRKDNRRCKVHVYLLVWLVGVLVLTPVFLPHGTMKFFMVVWSGLSAAGIDIWHVVRDLGIGIGQGIAWLGIHIWLWLSYAAILVWNFFTYCILGIPIIAYFAGAVGLFWLMDKLLPKTFGIPLLPEHKCETVLSPTNFRNSWANAIARIIESHSDIEDELMVMKYLELTITDECELAAIKVMLRSIVLYGVNNFYSSLLDQVQTIRITPFLNHDFWKWCDKIGVDVSEKVYRLTRLDAAHLVCSLTREDWKFDWYRFNQILLTAINTKFNNQVKSLALSLRNSKELEIERRDKWHQTWCYKKCMTVTSGLINGFERSCDLLGRTVESAVMAFQYCWKKFKQGCSQVKIFVVYLFMLVKAKKSKACPYFMFESGDTANRQSSQVNNPS